MIHFVLLRRLKRKHPADLTKDMTSSKREDGTAGGSHLHVNITVKKFYQMSKLDKLWIQIINKKNFLFYWNFIQERNGSYII